MGQCLQPLRLWLALAGILLLSLGARAGDRSLLWEIGTPDGKNAEFALAPGNYGQYQNDGLFIVGASDASKDWPYVHPGPSDSWAGSRSHTFSIVFGLLKTPAAGTCELRLDLVDTHFSSPPRLKISVNGKLFERSLPVGDTHDDSIRGNLDHAKAHALTVEFPSSALQTGNNQIDITTISGSWMLYDHVALETPAGAQSASVESYTGWKSVSVSPVLGEGKKGPYQRIRATLVHVGPPVEAHIRLDLTTLQRMRLTAGQHTYDLQAPPVKHASQSMLKVTSKLRTLASRPVTLTPGVDQIIVVFKTHFDIGYTDMASNIVQRYRTSMIDQALDVVDQNKDLPANQQFVWTLSGWPMHKILEDFPGQTAVRKQRIESALKEGRFAVHALPFTTHTELLEAEDLVRGLGYSTQMAKELGLKLPRDAKMTDVPEHTWMLPTLLHAAGVQFMHIGCNGMSAAPQFPPIFWWEGPDGSRVLTMYSPDYGTQLTPDKNWPCRTWLALLHTGDNHGPPRPDEVKRVLDEAAKKLPGVKVRIGRLSDFADAVIAENPPLPVVHGDTPDTWIHGPMSDPAGARLARNIRPLIAATEALNTELRSWEIKSPDVAPVISAAYEQSLLYGEHTWGGSIGWLNNSFSFGDAFKADRAKGRFARMEGSWDEHTAYIEKARDLTLPALGANLRSLVQSINVNGTRIVVYNPLPWKRDGLASIGVSGGTITALKTVDTLENVPTETVGKQLRFIARDIPPMGYRTYVLSTPQSDMSGLAVDTRTATFANSRFKIMLDPSRGVIRSLVDKVGNRELLDPAQPLGLGQYLYERFDSNQVWRYCKDYMKPGQSIYADFYKPGQASAEEVPYSAASPTNFNLRFEQTLVSVSAILEAPADSRIPNPVTTRMTLYANQPYLDLEITLHKKPFEPWPEAGWLVMPFNLDEPQFRLGRLGSIIDPATDIIAGANRHIFGLNTGLTMTDKHGRGVGICPMDHPLVSLDVPGCYKHSVDFIPRRPIAYLNLFNNQWNTNFRLWNEGTWTSRVRIWPVKNASSEAGLITPSLEARYPLLVEASDGAPGPLRSIKSGLELSHKGILVTAFGKNPDGAGTLLRLWEYSGHSGSCRVRLPDGMNVTSAQPVDLRGRPLGHAIRVKDGVFSAPVKAFAPVSVVLN